MIIRAHMFITHKFQPAPRCVEDLSVLQESPGSQREKGRRIRWKIVLFHSIKTSQSDHHRLPSPKTDANTTQESPKLRYLDLFSTNM